MTAEDSPESGEAVPSKEVHPRRLAIGVGIAAALFWLSGYLPLPADNEYPARMAAAITGFVATCWLGNAMPLAAASLLPLPLMPLLGVIPLKESATAYAHPIIWMFFGGFVLAMGIERWGLHRRLALNIIRRAGVNPSRLILGFMVAAAFLSQWLNNTSTTLMLLPIALALVQSMGSSGAVSKKGEDNFAFALLVGIAYACSIGGVGTPIGTAPNALYLTNYTPFEERGAPPITFLSWMIVAMPVVWIMIPATWALLTKFLAPQEQGAPEAREILEKEARSLPKMDQAEKTMLALFVLAALMWTTRRDVALGNLGTIPGWWRLTPVPDPGYLGDGAVAVFVALLSFLLPSGRKPGQALMDWDTAKRMPWDILFLIGGGIAIAGAFKSTGLAAAVGLGLKPVMGELSPIVMIALICFVMTFLTEVTSNTAMTSLLLPILAATSTAVGLDPRLLMLPACMSASCAFMLPISTPPNAIVFSSGRISMTRMAKTGFLINVMGVIVITIVTWLVAVPVLGIEIGSAPEWLRP